MDLFSITCTTCKSRLRVRDEAAIGQILACPKCGGMVMIKAPPSWSDGGAEAKSELPTHTEIISPRPTNQTLTDSAFDAVDELLSDAPPRLTPPALDESIRSAASRPRFVGGPPATVKPAAATAGVNEPAASSARAAASSTRGHSPPPPGESDGAELVKAGVEGPWRYWTLMAGSVAAGIALAFAAVTAAIHLSREDSISLDEGSPLVPAVATNAGSAEDSNPASVNPTESQSTPPPLPDATAPAEQVAADAPDTSATIHDQAPLPPKASADPVGLVQEPSPSTSSNPIDPLAKFDRLLGSDNPDRVSTLAEPTPSRTTEGTPPDATSSRPAAPRPPPRDIDVAKRLADPLAGIETSGTPLADFLQVLSDYSTIPISLELDPLPVVNVTAEAPIEFKAANTTVGGALAEGLRPLKLEQVIIGDQLAVRLAEPDPPAAIEVQVKDLVEDEQQLQELAELLMAVIEPSSWGDGEAAGAIDVDAAKSVLRVRNRRAVQAQLLLACDKLRVARGKPPVLKLDPATFKLETRWSQARPRLDTLISLNYSQPTRLVAVLHRLGEVGSMRILINWRDVDGAGWNPAGEATLLADKQPLSAALDALLTPLDLAWRVVDGQTIEVVTPASLAERAELEVYRVDGLLADDPTGETLLAKIRTALGEGALRDSGGSGEIRFDLEGQCLLASLSQPKQRELEALLAKWRGDAAK